ncbi:hypothetical protein LJ739_04300 [Aestuariibacter halophilus]|uniref:DNA repair protein n=1 Tax=Fluctibacter halophilus TaxID=226011 RepID=A0ABS8G701_9ALTE|nr:hypothetical protein [Aestuariibacter halophilus]MCC2615459.1 hypothetical protein [Aestuariibacter halophilus]
MVFSIVIILIVALIVVAIVVNAIQQHREKVEAEKRTEIAKQKSVIDETENVLLTIETIPVSPKMVQILYRRVLNALKIMQQLNPTQTDIKQRIRDAESKINSIDIEQPAPPHESFVLPENDKLIIQYIQAIKKFRILLRSEHSKGKVDTQSFVNEDRMLAALQLRVNVETLARRATSAIQSEMLGSARQYFEKAIAALAAQPQQTDYIIHRKAQLEEQLHGIQDIMRNANAEDRAKKREAERDELDELFAPKKKW